LRQKSSQERRQRPPPGDVKTVESRLTPTQFPAQIRHAVRLAAQDDGHANRQFPITEIVKSLRWASPDRQWRRQQAVQRAFRPPVWAKRQPNRSGDQNTSAYEPNDS